MSFLPVGMGGSQWLRNHSAASVNRLNSMSVLINAAEEFTISYGTDMFVNIPVP